MFFRQNLNIPLSEGVNFLMSDHNSSLVLQNYMRWSKKPLHQILMFAEPLFLIFEPLSIGFFGESRMGKIPHYQIKTLFLEMFFQLQSIYFMEENHRTSF